jgi:triphosphoribosyl-dephospho-CoA synthase
MSSMDWDSSIRDWEVVGFKLQAPSCLMKISEASAYACIIEAGTFKPGNIYPGRTGFLDLIISAMLLGKTLERHCSTEEVHLGQLIKEAVLERAELVPSNTNLGIILLHGPIAMAASISINNVEKSLDELIQKTTKEDAVEVAEAIQMSNAYIGKPQKGPDLKIEGAVHEIRTRGLTLFDLFLISSGWDTIASEWVNGFQITFSGAQKLMAGTSVLELYLDILSEYPDSLVQRRFGKGIAKKISEKARILRDCPLDDLRKWDQYLHSNGINPGTTADLVASSIFVALVKEEDLLKKILDAVRTVNLSSQQPPVAKIAKKNEKTL